MKKIASLDIPDGVKSVDIYKTPSGILIDFTRDNKSIKIGDVIVFEKAGKATSLYVVQNNRNPYKTEEWEFFWIANIPNQGRVPTVTPYFNIDDNHRIASEKEKLTFLWDLEHRFSFIWDESSGRMLKKE